ncbi:FG-GAP repeat protein [Dapis sp. BLCC M126]|uniref:FG-GAP repeat protein n=1 Tax=Dapis sp. BLCC M126 TaxID=3400189 RepID=UPI003CF24F61
MVATKGATMAEKMTYGGNWVIVGYKGAKPGRAVENFSAYIQPADAPTGVAVKYWELPTEPLKKDLKVGQKLWRSDASFYFSDKGGVGIDGDYALVGDYGKNNVSVYRWHDSQWQLQQEILPKSRQGGNFGISTDISGNLAIVGRSGATVSDKTKCGAADIYEFKGGQWQHQQILQPSDLKTQDYFGSSVAIDSKKAIVGVWSADAPGKENCGAAYIFHLENGKWVQKAKLQPLDLGASDRLGISVAIVAFTLTNCKIS